jgi:hypothetical protein
LARVSAYDSASVDLFLATDPYHVLGALAAAHSHDLEVDRRQAWEEELRILVLALSGLRKTFRRGDLAQRRRAPRTWV